MSGRGTATCRRSENAVKIFRTEQLRMDSAAPEIGTRTCRGDVVEFCARETQKPVLAWTPIKTGSSARHDLELMSATVVYGLRGGDRVQGPNSHLSELVGSEE